LTTASFSRDEIHGDVGLDLHLVTEAWSKIRSVYVDQTAVKPQALTYGAIQGMVDALGDTGHSHFLTPISVKRERDFTEGKLEGIGAEVRMKNDHPVIVAPIDGSPARKAGLKPGDTILKVNGETMSALSLDQVVDRIVGPPGTSVMLTILRSTTGRAMELTIKRARLTLHGVSWVRLPGIPFAHLRIAHFDKGVTKDLQKALLQIQGEELTGLILDLRSNPGGLFDQAVGTASQFLENGNVVLEKNHEGRITPVPVQPGGSALTLPLVVLIDGGTASAAEIVAAALRDGHRALLVGEQTFGTGTVLSMFPLSDGSALMLAIKEWLTPAGQVIWHQGIPPDLPVPLPAEVTPQFPEAERTMSLEALRASKDEQLLRALDLITQPAKKGKPAPPMGGIHSGRVE